MTNRQRSKLDSYNRVSDFDETYETELATILEYAAEQDNFDAAVAAILEALGTQVHVTGVSDGTTDVQKVAMGKVVIKYALRGSVVAQQMGNATLAAQLHEPLTFITAANKTTAIERATDLRNTMNNNLAVLTNITTANIAEIDGAIKAYTKVKDLPVEDIETKKADGTDALPALFAAADKALNNMYNLVFSYFETDDPDMVDNMHLAMNVILTGTRHNIIDFTLVADEDGSALAGVNIADTSNEKNYTTNAVGLGHIPTHKIGAFSFVISAAGRQTVNFGAEIKPRTDNEFTVRLVKG